MKLKRCRSCGNMIAKDAYACPLCGSKQKKSHGCLLFFILIVLVFIGICTAGNRNSSPENNASNHQQDREENKAKSANKSSSDPFQVEVFSKDVALIFVQNFLEEKINSAVNARIKFTSVANIEKLSDAIPEFSDLMQKNKEKIGTTINAQNVWIVEQEFCDRDNPTEKFSYYALVEFAKGKGYRVIFMSVGDVQIWPVASK